MQRQIRPEDVRLGMYVCGFGGSWFSHPFWRAKFVLKTQHDLERVQGSGVSYVVIDDALGLGIVDQAGSPPVAAARPVPVSIRLQRPERSAQVQWDEREKALERSDKQQAKALVSRSMKVLRTAFADVRLGRAVRMDEVTAIVDDVVGTVDRSPRTLLEILRLKSKNEYTYLHSVAVCTLMVNAARHMGKGAAETRDYGLAGLLHDLGKMGVDDAILNKEGKLTEAEFLAVRNHPEHGYQVLSQSPNIPEAALDVCRHHHEKMDGSGYPFGLPAEAISLVARLGAVCDVYDALTSERAYKNAWSPVEALTAMWSWQGHFDQGLLFTFMQSIGVFPAGMLVQLRSNRLALVLENKRRASRPRVLAFYATRDRQFIAPEDVTIQDNLANDSIVAAADPAEWGFADWDAMVERLLRGDGPALAA
ncbi:HD-GYP domain-containing protein [Novosphingobium sp. JCM 18896]|uniref:HD-GYP domain-containing protein n=1 Tax=Novosphingobium sp. JCM 18896 TaxID=2989731 RepID=UPI0022214279|nr:HD-GYP domain-containing protein [Novosphingobium sp. JCM 18896]MCW1429042.1 HD-GYP domain-containing protein [Novosphingobium sp. JCM 18896]